MDKKVYDSCIAILEKELKIALGCTEPIAIAYAAAKARATLGEMPEKCTVSCSGNIIKNVMGVAVPNSNGMKGIDVATALGIVGGDEKKELAVLEGITPKDIEKAKELLNSGFCSCKLIKGVENLFIIVRVESKESYAEVEIRNHHTNVTRVTLNGRDLVRKDEDDVQEDVIEDKSFLTVRNIYDFAETVNISDIADIIDKQITCNSALSNEGIQRNYGAEVGRTILSSNMDRASIEDIASAYAAAGSDARMSGCSLPAVINSGSGNQGITVTMPVLVYAKEYGIAKERVYRALVISNLIAIHQKSYIGSLSAYCGAVSAACGSAAGVCYLMGGSYEKISDTITNSSVIASGMVCDGAKPSCAAKIATSVKAALLAMNMSLKNNVFHAGEGLVRSDVEKTIEGIGRLGRDGMKTTDYEILNMMLEG